MEKLFYPAIFHEAEEDGYWIIFPDLPECITEGNSMSEAYEMAVDALDLALTERIREKEELPEASDIRKIEDDGIFVMIPFDELKYNRN